MADRRVTHTAKSAEGTITDVGNPGEEWYSRTTAEAIRDIESGDYTYHVGAGSSRTDIQVVKGRSGKYLRTVPNDEGADNLDELPDLEPRPESVTRRRPARSQPVAGRRLARQSGCDWQRACCRVLCAW